MLILNYIIIFLLIVFTIFYWKRVLIKNHNKNIKVFKPVLSEFNNFVNIELPMRPFVTSGAPYEPRDIFVPLKRKVY